MTRIIMCGCNGKMGQVITQIVKEDDNAEIVAGIDISGKQLSDYPVYEHITECNIEADVLIDFSSPVALDELLAEGIKRNLPMVLCSTGYNEEQVAKITEASKQVAILRSANMSLGVNLLIQLAKKATALLEDNFDIEIVEKHHNQKLDVPSGTALLLADGIKAIRPTAVYNVGRHENGKRQKNEIGIHSIRMGNEVGTHEIIFALDSQVIALKHEAENRGLFAEGSLTAASFLVTKDAGFYNMDDILE